MICEEIINEIEILRDQVGANKSFDIIIWTIICSKCHKYLLIIVTPIATYVKVFMTKLDARDDYEFAIEKARDIGLRYQLLVG